MSKGFSKAIIKRQKSAQLLVETVAANDQAIATAVDKLFAPHLEEGEEAPNVLLVLRLAARVIAKQAAALGDADQAHAIELADDKAPRDARDEYTDKLRTSLVELRAGVEAVYGPAGLDALGIAAAVPTDAAALVSFGTTAHKLLLKPKLGAPVSKAVTVNLPVFAKSIGIRVRKLSVALADVAREKREAQVTLAAKDKAQESNDYHFQRVGSLIESLARVAGLDEVAAKARPSSRKPGQTEQEEQAEPVEEETDEEEETEEPTK